ncbi:hypothetical protein M3P05_20230 [Sansalvadorimonas sp. 2012CJ34-2]|uniref:Lipoprotein n=1 Tax=Parendozoicomonas callyspongiae TaxID=2942213 RepID=A0ABT0PLK2_9GAMM|nr:hypothetical protein [Sansalvadorimonas sp. 2012CJ34-2]MCL6272252.1 hypothetical protein [Sansalvadorimonas sp. 2012CJ34-2]
MREKFLIFYIAISALFLNGCSNPEESISAIEVQFTQAASLNNDGKLIISGTTNLPDSTSLLISLDNETTGFSAQSKATVNGSEFISEPLGPKTGLADGSYTVNILMPNPRGQAEKVRKLIGDKGQNISGKLVVPSSLGFNVVDFNFNIKIGSEESIESSKVEHQKLVSGVHEKVTSLIKQGIEMESLRASGQIEMCMEKMRRLQPETTDLRELSSSLPLKYMSLKSAVIESYSCVSCSRSANDACNRASKDLEQFEI